MVNLKEKLKIGYVVEFNDGEMGIVAGTKYDNYIALDGGDEILFLSWFDTELALTEGLRNIKKLPFYVATIYGYPKSPQKLLSNPININDREIIWSRAAVKMTLKEIEDKLGFAIEIIEDGKKDAT